MVSNEARGGMKETHRCGIAGRKVHSKPTNVHTLLSQAVPGQVGQWARGPPRPCHHWQSPLDGEEQNRRRGSQEGGSDSKGQGWDPKHLATSSHTGHVPMGQHLYHTMGREPDGRGQALPSTCTAFLYIIFYIYLSIDDYLEWYHN